MVVKPIKRQLSSLLLMIILATSSQAFANDVVIKKVVLKQTSNGYTIDVTLLHADTGWDHYADGWEVLDDKKNVIASRVLYHPHVAEQPFTRSLYDVKIPAGLKTIYIRAHDKVHGHGPLYPVELK